MFSLLLAIIYMAFISLGLPDGLLGAAWPSMVDQFQVPLSFAGIISIIIAAGTVTSSLLSDKVNRRFGTGWVTAISVLMTALALAGFAWSKSFWLLCFLAIPYGLGAGGVDAALNNYVALHFASRHMNWLHCFWGVGAIFGPYIMGWALGAGYGWPTGYGTVAIIQFVLVACLFLSLPLWKKKEAVTTSQEENLPPIGLRKAVAIPGVASAMLAFFFLCAFENTASLWASSYLVDFRHMAPDLAASYASLFYLGVAGGRFACGFVSDRIGDKNMIRIGAAGMLLGIGLIALPAKSPILTLVGLLVMGIGNAPVFPAIIHSAPVYFGRQRSQVIIGILMASAYTGILSMPSVFGLIAQHIHIGFYPLFLGVCSLLLLVLIERVNRICQ